MARAKVKADQRAATRGGGFTGLPHVVQDSAAYRHLSLYARSLLFELVRRFNGYNNGRIGLSFEVACECLNTTNKRAIARAFAELVQHGLVEVMAAHDRKHHKAREYRLTFISTGDCNRHVQATEEYRNWTPEPQNHGDDVSPRKRVHGDDVSLRRPIHGDDVSLRIAQHRQKSVVSPAIHGDDVSPHIIKPYPPGQTEGPKGENGLIDHPFSGSADFVPTADVAELIKKTARTLRAAA
jgi:hypothetical protein